MRRLFGKRPDPVGELGAALAEVYAKAAGSDEKRVRDAYVEAFDVYWRREYAPLVEWRVRPPLVEGFAMFLRAPTVRARVVELTGSEPVEPSAAALLRVVAAEAAAVSSAARADVRDSIQPIRWDEVPSTVLVPGWRQRAGANARAVVGMTVGGAGRAATDPMEVTKRLIPSESQAYLEPQTMADTGIQTLAYAVAVALVDAGGVVHAPPGVPYAIDIGGGRIEPWTAMEALAAGEMRVADWEGQCRLLDVADVPLKGPENGDGPAEAGPS